MNKVWQEDAWEDYLYWQTQDKKTLKRINLLIQDISSMKESENRNPCAAIYPVGGAVELMIQTALSTVFATDSWKLRSAVPITAISRYLIPLDLKSGGIFYILMILPPVSGRESYRSASLIYLFSCFCPPSIFDISFSFPLCYH